MKSPTAQSNPVRPPLRAAAQHVRRNAGFYWFFCREEISVAATVAEAANSAVIKPRVLDND
jgi:hypothetical protein